MKLIFCPLDSYGFVYPLIGIAQILRSRGHEIAFVSGLESSSTLQTMGFPRIRRGESDGASFNLQTWGIPSSVAIQVKHLEYAVTQFPADVLVTTQLTLGPLLIGEMAKLPVVVLGLAAYMWPPCWPPGYEPKSRSEQRLQWRYSDMMRHYNKSRSLIGLSPTNADPALNPFLGDLFLLQSVPELECAEFDFPTKVHFVGSCVWEPSLEDPDLSSWLEESNIIGMPIIYVQPGRSFGFQSFWPSLLSVLKDKPIRVAASLGRMDGNIGSIPENFFARDHLPMGKILPHASAVISTGHTTAVLGALTHGLPLLLLPYGSGADDIAERCERAGAALCFYDYRKGVTASFLDNAIDELLHNSSLKYQAASLREKLTQGRGISYAAKLIEMFWFSRQKASKLC